MKFQGLARFFVLPVPLRQTSVNVLKINQQFTNGPLNMSPTTWNSSFWQGKSRKFETMKFHNFRTLPTPHQRPSTDETAIFNFIYRTTEILTQVTFVRPLEDKTFQF